MSCPHIAGDKPESGTSLTHRRAAGRGYPPSEMPTQAEIEFFARWNDVARRADQRDDEAMTMSDRLDAVAALSTVVDALRDGVDDALGGIRRA